MSGVDQREEATSPCRPQIDGGIPTPATPPKPPPGQLRSWAKILGPGFITGASDDDPSGIGTYAMAGAALGYSLLWTALFTFPMMAAVQFISAKIGLVTGTGLGGVLKQHYPRLVVYPVVFALLIANTINAGADIIAIAAGVNLLFPIPIGVLLLPIAFVILVTQIWGSYRLITNIFRWLCLSLLAYIGASLLARPDWYDALRGTLWPTVHADRKFLAILVAILGTTISPYLFFWQSNQEVEEKWTGWRRKLWRRRGVPESEVRYAAWDVSIGMFASNLVMYFIILASAATLHRAGETEIESASKAAEALKPLAGNSAYILMALGLIGTGLLAVPILTASAAYALSETFGWKAGLAKKPGLVKGFYVVIAVSTLAGLGISLIGIGPIQALFWAAVINGCLAPPVLVLIMLVGNNAAIMGKRVNGFWTNVLGWGTALVMSAAAVGLFVSP
jgi:NRAMP (natural resistance-associated macrophage protein)-like metal ion transporter